VVAAARISRYSRYSLASKSKAKVTSVKRGVLTSLQVRIEELSSGEVVAGFTNFEFRFGIEGGKGDSQSRGAEESDCEDSEFGCVLHGVLVIKEDSCEKK